MGAAAGHSVWAALILLSCFIIITIRAEVRSKKLRNDPDVKSAKVTGAGLSEEWVMRDPPKERGNIDSSRAQESDQRVRRCRRHHRR